VLAAVSILLSLRRFREVADEIGQGRIGDYAFSQRNIVPELSSVARDFDKLVLDLKHLSQQIRQSAEDNAHSFKTPLAAIQSSLSPVRAPCRWRPARAARARDHRLLARPPARAGQRRAALRQQHRRPDRGAARADQSHPAGRRGDAQLPRDHGEPRHPPDPPARRRASCAPAKGMLEIVLQNILENAISFSPRGGTIILTLTQTTTTVELQVDDEGPGIPPTRSITSSSDISPPAPATGMRRRNTRALASGSCAAMSRRSADR
jgi:two-component system sensor histidine kinase ChvG